LSDGARRLAVLMADSLVKAANINERAMAARQSREAADRLIGDFMPFLHGLAQKYARQFEGYGHDDMLSVAMLAFYESIQSYDSDKGHFFPFAKRVVNARVIDHVRAQGRHRGQTVPLDDDDPDREAAQSAYVEEASTRAYDAERRQEMLREEIEVFTAELSEWGISMEALARRSPKHKRLREQYRAVVSLVAESPDIVQTIQLKRYFPVSAVAELTGIPPKKLERARIFVLASLIIKFGDYEILSEYVMG